MNKRAEKPQPMLRPVYLRMSPELVSWLDSEARRQRRSRAYVVAQAVRVFRAMLEQIDQEKTA